MRRSVALALVTGWIIGVITLWLGIGIAGGWYTYVLFDGPTCSGIQQNGLQFPPGIEITPGQPNPCYHRYARFHLP